jgi:hypothetical protein
VRLELDVEVLSDSEADALATVLERIVNYTRLEMMDPDPEGFWRTLRAKVYPDGDADLPHEWLDLYELERVMRAVAGVAQPLTN